MSTTELGAGAASQFAKADMCIDELVAAMQRDGGFVDLNIDGEPVFSGTNVKYWRGRFSGREGELAVFLGAAPDARLITSMRTLIALHPGQNKPVVHGLLRLGETMNVIAPPKVGKSWLVHGLARSIASGSDWLGFRTARGRVLLCDNELHPSELAQRLKVGATDPSGSVVHGADIDVLALRGRSIDVNGLARILSAEVTRDAYSLIVLDALYRLLPVGISENDNASMMQIYNQLDQIAAKTGAAIVVIHHASKGDQSTKSVTDVGAGAGSISRATDSHLIIRPHEESGLFVLQAVCRSFAQPSDRTIEWSYPHWKLSTLAPSVAMKSSARDEKQRRLDKEADEAVHLAFGEKPLSVSELRRITGMGQQRVERALYRIGALSKRARSKRTGKTTERFYLPKPSEIV